MVGDLLACGRFADMVGVSCVQGTGPTGHQTAGLLPRPPGVPAGHRTAGVRAAAAADEEHCGAQDCGRPDSQPLGTLPP